MKKATIQTIDKIQVLKFELSNKEVLNFNFNYILGKIKKVHLICKAGAINQIGLTAGFKFSEKSKNYFYYSKVNNTIARKKRKDVKLDTMNGLKANQISGYIKDEGTSNEYPNIVFIVIYTDNNHE